MAVLTTWSPLHTEVAPPIGRAPVGVPGLNRWTTRAHPPTQPWGLSPWTSGALIYACQACQMVNNLPAMRETQVQSLGREDPLEKGMATHSSILAWSMPWTEEPAGLPSVRSQRVRHDWVNLSSHQSVCAFRAESTNCPCSPFLSAWHRADTHHIFVKWKPLQRGRRWQQTDDHHWPDHGSLGSHLFPVYESPFLCTTLSTPLVTLHTLLHALSPVVRPDWILQQA